MNDNNTTVSASIVSPPFKMSRTTTTVKHQSYTTITLEKVRRPYRPAINIGSTSGKISSAQATAPALALVRVPPDIKARHEEMLQNKTENVTVEATDT